LVNIPESGQKRPTPEIVVVYRDYIPPCDVRRILSVLLRYVPSENLVGLKSIVVTNSDALSRDERRQKTWSRNRKIRSADALGLYYKSTPHSGATIRIYVDNILRTYPKSLLWVRPLLNLYFGDVLYHELGHHIHATLRPEYRGKEDVADKWKRKFSSKFISSRYWYLFPVAIVIKLVVDLTGDVRALIRKFATKTGPAGGQSTNSR
jgi:hypothetical protein